MSLEKDETPFDDHAWHYLVAESEAFSEGKEVGAAAGSVSVSLLKALRRELMEQGFDLRSLIGRGGMALVWEAEQLDLGRPVALKILSPRADLSKEEALARFQREGRAGGRLHHPNIVQTYSLGKTEGYRYIVQELVRGETLEQVLDRDSSPPRGEQLEQIVEWFIKLSDALAHAHGNGVIHRDIKPSNVILEGGQEPRLADFGLAKLAEDPAMSSTGQIFGTPFYMSPEQILGEVELDARTDIYSLGATLYQLLTGRRPLEADSTPTLLRLILDQDPTPPQRHNPHLPPGLAAVCLKAMAKKPEERYAKAEELRNDLQQVQRGQPVSAREPTSLDRLRSLVRRHPTTSATSAVGFAALLCIAALIILLRRDSPGEGRDQVAASTTEAAPARADRPFTYEELQIHLRTSEQPKGYRVQRDTDQRLIFLEPSAGLRHSTLQNPLEQCFGELRSTWKAGAGRRDFPVVRLLTEADRDRLGRAQDMPSCRYDPASRELWILSPVHSQYRWQLPQAAFEQFFDLAYGDLETHPWLIEGFRQAYGHRAGGLIAEQPLQSPHPKSRELVTMDAEAWAQETAIHRAAARDLALYLLEHPSDEAWICLRKYLATLDRIWPESSPGPPERQRLLRSASESAWSGFDWESFERRRRAAKSD